MEELTLEELAELISGITQFNPASYQYFNQLLNHRTVIFNQDVDENIIESNSNENSNSMPDIEIKKDCTIRIINPLTDTYSQRHIQQIREYHLLYIHERCITEHTRIGMKKSESDKT